MNTSLIFRNCITAALLLWTLGWNTPALADQPSFPKVLMDWQSNLLFDPTPRQRANERRGRVVIYDGLKDRTVEKVLDEQFQRIQHMMFTRVIRTDDSGEPKRDESGAVVIEDDGC